MGSHWAEEMTLIQVKRDVWTHRKKSDEILSWAQIWPCLNNAKLFNYWNGGRDCSFIMKSGRHSSWAQRLRACFSLVQLRFGWNPAMSWQQRHQDAVRAWPASLPAFTKGIVTSCLGQGGPGQLISFDNDSHTERTVFTCCTCVNVNNSRFICVGVFRNCFLF